MLAPSTNPAPLFEGARVLVVSEDRGGLNMLQNQLAELSMAVAAVPSAEIALRVIPRMQPEIVVLDESVVGADTGALTERIRQLEGCSELPVLVGHSSVPDLSRAVQAGVSDYLRSPLMHEEVVLRLRIHLMMSELRDRQGEATARLEATDRHLQTVIDNISDGVFTCDSEGRMQAINPQLARLAGRDQAALIGRHFSVLLTADDAERWHGSPQTLVNHLARGRERGEADLGGRRDGGGDYVLDLKLNSVDGEDSLYVGVARDITLQREYETQLLELSQTDSLTDLGNRRKFDEAYAREWQRAFRSRAPLSLLLIDVDHFKQVNDRNGHRYGDQCLKAVAAMINEVVRRPADIACRYGGDEFALILPDTAVGGAEHLAEALCQRARDLVVNGNGEAVDLTVSIGAATMVPHTNNVSSLLIDSADRALYQAKNDGRDRVVVQRPRPVSA